MSSFKRKTYGKVRPVKQPKPKAPDKPKILELKRILSKLKKCTDWQAIDVLSEAIVWWHGSAMRYITWRYTKVDIPLDAAKAGVRASAALNLMHSSKMGEDKLKYASEVLSCYARYAAPIFKAPSHLLPLKKTKVNTKTAKAVNKKLNAKHDSTLTLLSQALGHCPFKFQVAVELDQTEDLRFDHVQKIVYFSKKYLQVLKKAIWQSGLLPVVILLAKPIARGMSYDGTTNGQFRVDQIRYFTNYEYLLEGFALFAASKDSPRSLVRKEKKAKVAVIKKEITKG